MRIKFFFFVRLKNGGPQFVYIYLIYTESMMNNKLVDGIRRGKKRGQIFVAAKLTVIYPTNSKEKVIQQLQTVNE